MPEKPDVPALWDSLPLLKKLPSTAFGLGALPLVCYLTGWVPKEEIYLFGGLCWVAAGLVMTNDLINAIIRRLNQKLTAIPLAKLQEALKKQPAPVPSAPKPPQPPAG